MGPRSDNRGYVLMPRPLPRRCRYASMGPRSDNRGYAGRSMIGGKPPIASMGPRSDNRGYAGLPMCQAKWGISFNGSTVGEPWLSDELPHPWSQDHTSFNGSTVREPWLCSEGTEARPD